MSKSKCRVKKSVVSSTRNFIGISDERDYPICCSNRNCPSHWHNRLTEKLKFIQESKLKSSTSVIATPKPKRHYKLLYPDVLSRLFLIDETDDSNHELYTKPVCKSAIMTKFDLFASQVSKAIGHATYTFAKINLTFSMKYRMIPLISDLFIDQMGRMGTSKQSRINLLRINHVHSNSHLRLKIISKPVWNHSAVHIIVQDQNEHCVRLSIYNWSHTVNARQIKSDKYVQQQLTSLLPLNSTIVLLDPWLKICHDGDVALRCESPNTHIILVDFQANCTSGRDLDVEQLRQLGNTCYQADDNLSAIEYYTYALQQLDEQQEKDQTSEQQPIGLTAEKREQHRILLLSNRCACYIRERHAALALADAGILFSLQESFRIPESPTASTAEKLLLRCLNAHLYLALFDQAEKLLNSQNRYRGLCNGENSTPIAALEKELKRLKDETDKGQYNLQDLLSEQVNCKVQTFIDLPHYHAKFRRSDSFEIRPCPFDEIDRKGYPSGSYGVYALKDLEPGTLLIVEQPFASVDNRVIGEEYSHSINYWHTQSKPRFCLNDKVRLLNEVERQLLIGSAISTTFDRIKLMQPIRQWLMKNTDENTAEYLHQNHDIDLNSLDNYESILATKKQWEKPFFRQVRPPLPHIPWEVLFETEQQNPYKSQSTNGWYPLGSMFNHSCLPNCIWYLIGDCLFIYVCSSSVRQGDELTISYCPLWISSVNERAYELSKYGVTFCQCSLCLYDRSVIDECGQQLRKFSHIRALTRQENISDLNRFSYLKNLHDQYKILAKTYQNRPVGFIGEFIDIERILLDFKNETNNREIQTFISDEFNSFKDRILSVCRFSLPNTLNPVLLFGTPTKLLLDHAERMDSCELNKWSGLFQCLYSTYVFKCHVPSNDSQKVMHDLKEVLRHLFQTQTFASSSCQLKRKTFN